MQSKLLFKQMRSKAISRQGYSEPVKRIRNIISYFGVNELAMNGFYHTGQSKQFAQNVMLLYNNALLGRPLNCMQCKISLANYNKLLSESHLLTHLSLASLLWDIGKQNSPRCDAAERGVPSGAILFAYREFSSKNWIKLKNYS